MLQYIEEAFNQVGIQNVLERARDIRINEYLESLSTTIKLCGVTVKEIEQTEQLMLILNKFFGKQIKIYHHFSSQGSYGGVVIRIRGYLLSDLSLLKVNENLTIPTKH